MVEQMLPTYALQANKFNPNVMADEEFQALKADMKLVGPKRIDPVLVSPFEVFYGKAPSLDEPPYVVVDGEHRWRGATEIEWAELRCDVEDITEEDAKGICYRKSKERGTIDPFKEAALFKSEVDVGLTQKAIAEKFIVDSSTVSHRLSLLRLVPEIKAQLSMLPRGTVTPSHLEPIASLPEGEQKKVKLTEEKWNGGGVRTVQSIATEAKRIKDELAAKEALCKALETAKVSKCPQCNAPPGRIDSQGLPWVNCSEHSWDSDHTWNLETGKPKYEPVRVQQGFDKQKKPEFSRVIRSNYTVKELTQAFFKSIHDALPQLESAEKITVEGIIGKTLFRVDFDHYGNRRMSAHVKVGGESIGIVAEEKAYQSGEKSKVDISDWTPTKEDIDRHVEFIENAFKGLLLPLPEKKKKAKDEARIETKGMDMTVPCDSCGNDSENGGDCHRENFRVNSNGSAYVCERKLHMPADHSDAKTEEVAAAS